MKTGNDLVNPIAQAPIGSKVKIGYVRDRQAKETNAVVEDRTRVFPNSAAGRTIRRTTTAQLNMACASKT